MSHVLVPDMKILCKKPTNAAIAVPTVTSTLGVSSIKDIDALTNGASSTYKPRNFILLVPFLDKDVSKAIFKT